MPFIWREWKKSLWKKIFKKSINIHFVKFLVVFFGFLSGVSEASIVAPDDKPYFGYNEGPFTYYVTEDHFEFLQKAIAIQPLINDHFRHSYQWQLDDSPVIVIGSKYWQISNGFATVLPYLSSYFFIGGTDFLDAGAIPDWGTALLLHEKAHLYQLNSKSRFPSQLHNVFGNVILFPLVFLPIFIHPNIFTPTIFLEGNATYNESKFGRGGRLFSGEGRALFYSLLKDGKLGLNYLMNNHLEFPFGAEKYIVGGYFSEFLQEKYGDQRSNSFYTHHAERYMNPFDLTKTFEGDFKTHYEYLFSQFKQRYGPFALKSQRSSTPSIFKSLANLPMHREGSKILLLTTNNLKSYPWITEFNTDSRQWTKTEIDLPYGKIFEIEPGLYASASTGPVSHKRIQHSLFLPELQNIEAFNNQIVLDKNGSKYLIARPENIYSHVKLYVGRRFIGNANSSGLINSLQDVFYFKQKGEMRQAFKNDEMLFEYKGYYGKPVDVDDQGQFYFIASTEFGSSLFTYQNQKLVRLLPSDGIVNAKKISAREFLVAEITSSGIEYKIEKVSKVLESPAEYQYTFQQEEFFNFNKILDRQISSPPELQKDKIFEYHSLLDLRYSRTETFFAWDEENDFVGSLSLFFNDPLQFNHINIEYLRGANLTDSALISYINSKNPLNWYFGYLYEEEVLLDTRENILDRRYDWKSFLGLSYNFLKWRDWFFNFGIEASYFNDDQSIGESLDQFGALTEFQLQKSKSYPLSYDPYRKYHLNLAHQITLDEDTGKINDNRASIKTNVLFDWGHEIITEFNGGWGFSENDELRLFSSIQLRPSPLDFQRLLPGDSTAVRELKTIGLTLKKVVNWPKYFYRFPLSLRRWAPFARVNYFDIREDKERVDEEEFTEWEIGVELELLVLHLLPIKTKASFVDDDLSKDIGVLNFSIHTQYDF